MTTAAQAPTFPAEVVRWREEFESFRAGLPPAEPEWLRGLRATGIGAFEELGFPTTRQEDWRHTSVAAIARTGFHRPPATASVADLAVLDALDFGHAFARRELVFVNGRYAPTLSAETRRTACTSEPARELTASPSSSSPISTGRPAVPAVPSALESPRSGRRRLRFHPEGLVLAEPIHVVFLSAPGSEPTASHPRVLVWAGRKSQAAIVESYGGPADAVYLTNAVTEITVEDGAVVYHYRLQRESNRAFHVGALSVTQGRATRFSSHAISLGASLSRLDIRQVFAGEGGECILNGLFLAGDRQHTDTHTWVDHAQPHCSTRELYKGIVDDKARGVFVGRIVVRPGAQKTDAIQSNKNLILSREALVDSLPQLEILADDVKCKHGSTTGQLDPLALFYLRSRGIGEEAARALLTYAFASDVVQRIGIEALRTGLTEHLQRRLPGTADLKEAVV
jgi:Fe-S cluster assembly protein SufD